VVYDLLYDFECVVLYDLLYDFECVVYMIYYMILSV